MREIGAFEAKNRLAALLAAVEAGEEIVITRRGRPIARLVRAVVGMGGEDAGAAKERLRALRRGVTLDPDTSLRALIEEGRG